MKKLTNPVFIFFLTSICTLISCKNESLPTVSTSAVNVVNAVTGLIASNTVIKINGSGHPLSFNTYRDSVSYGNVIVLGVKTDVSQISGAAPGATAQQLFSVPGTFNPGGLYSLYLTGISPNVETILREEHYPVYKDSTLAVRIVNLSTNSTPINVTLSGSSTVNEFTSLPYKQSSDFKAYSAKTAVTSSFFNFQVRNSTGTLLASYAFTAANLTAARSKSVTLVFRGLIGGTGASAPAISFVPNY